jgi:hypothetical protein
MSQQVQIGDTVMLHPTSSRPECPAGREDNASAVVTDIDLNQRRTKAKLSRDLHGFPVWDEDNLVVVQRA